MSVSSDDTDVLILVPPDLFAVKEENFKVNMKRFGSSDTLTQSTTRSLSTAPAAPRSLHNTPNKLTSPFKWRNNILTTEPYLSQKLRDDQQLREVNDYFNKKQDQTPIMDLEEVHNVVRDIQQMNLEITDNPLKSIRRNLNFNEESTEELSLNILKDHLEEEQCRRKHCEQIIHSLQEKLLEHEETLAVQNKLNKEKDMAIKNLRENWEELSGQWKQKEEMNKLWEEEKIELKQNIKRYEDELSKALDLAHGYKEKCESAIKERKSIRSESLETKEKLKSIEEERDNLIRQISARDETLLHTRSKLAELRQEIKQAKEQEERWKADKLRLNDRLECFLKREKNLEIQLQQMEKTKVDIKKFYQEQVETIVLEKQKEFQHQLQIAEKTLEKQQEVKQQQLNEAHLKEIELLERKHNEEINLLNIKLQEKEERLDALLKKQSCLVEKLHAVVETQWQETLKILVSSRDDEKKPFTRQNTFTKEHKNGNCPTYRVEDEIPQKLQTDPGLKHYIEKLLNHKVNNVDTTLDNSLLENSFKNDTDPKSDKPKQPWKP